MVFDNSHFIQLQLWNWTLLIFMLVQNMKIHVNKKLSHNIKNEENVLKHIVPIINFE